METIAAPTDPICSWYSPGVIPPMAAAERNPTNAAETTAQTPANCHPRIAPRRKMNVHLSQPLLLYCLLKLPFEARNPYNLGKVDKVITNIHPCLPCVKCGAPPVPGQKKPSLMKRIVSLGYRQGATGNSGSRRE